MIDVSATIVANSQQLNADDLIGGPIAVQILDVKLVGGDQPVVVTISGDHMPWMPCKTDRRVLVHAWGKNAEAWIGRWVELYRDADVRFGGKAVGGIRIGAMSDIKGPMTLSLSVSKGKKGQYAVRKLDAPRQSGAPTADLDALLAQHEIPEPQLNAWLESRGKGAPVPPEHRAECAAWLVRDGLLDEIKAFGAA